MFANTKRILFILIVIPLALFVVALGIYVQKIYKAKAPRAAYQAVFLTNGQVYFGTMSRTGKQYVTLRDIYYLQTRQPLQETGGKKAEAPQEPELTLVKLGEELHGPMDSMQINRDHILFIEDLRDDGRVVTAIRQRAADGKTK